jgi:uncharacterized protein (TIGR03083 family)
MDHIADLERDGRALLAAARTAGLDAPVAACPGWDVSRLVGHAGKVLERTTILVTEGLDAPPPAERLPRFPDDETTFDRFADALDAAAGALREADPDRSCWNFTGDDLTAGFWRRRMANEIAVHRADAEIAAGISPTVDPERAVDAIDELVTVMLPFSAKLKNPELEGSFHLHCTDTEGEWLVVAAGGRLVTTREHAKGDIAVRGPASALLLWSYNRVPVGTEGLESFGEPALLEGWASIVP